VLSTGSKAAKQAAAAALANVTVDSKTNQRAVAAAPGAVSCLAQMLASNDEASQVSLQSSKLVAYACICCNYQAA
jgi:hypothetical protein